MMGSIYCSDTQSIVPGYIESLVKASCLLGTVIGLPIFGYLADKYGRKKTFKIALIIIMIGEIGSCFSADLKTGLGIFATLGIWRIFLGIGIGGIFPISVLVSEFAPKRTRGLFLSIVKAFQGLGMLVASVVSIIFLEIFKTAIINDSDNLDNVWRLCICVGIIPCLIAYYLLNGIPETIRYTLQVEGNMEKAQNDLKFINERNFYKRFDTREIGSSQNDFWISFKKYFGKWANLKYLIAFSICRFMINSTAYGINWNTRGIIEAFGFTRKASDKTPFAYNFDNSVANIYIALAGVLPGYLVCIGLIEVIGRKKIQIFGFAALFLFMLTFGAAYNQIKNIGGLFIGFYIALQFFTSFGPFTVVWILASEFFPTRFRSTTYCISAAFGKLGAVVSQAGLFFIKDIGETNKQLYVLLIIFSTFMLIGFIFSFFIPEAKGKSLEELEDFSKPSVPASSL